LVFELLTAASTVPATTTTEVGSPSIASDPAGLGAAGSAMSTKPSRSPGLSVKISFMPSGVAVMISAEVWVLGSVPSGSVA
jgi:hypothetical protein